MTRLCLIISVLNSVLSGLRKLSKLMYLLFSIGGVLWIVAEFCFGFFEVKYTELAIVAGCVGNEEVGFNFDGAFECVDTIAFTEIEGS